MSELLTAFDADHLVRLSLDRRNACLSVLRALERSLAPTPLERAASEAVAAFLTEHTGAGYSVGTLYKRRAMILGFYGWAWREGHISGDALLDLRAIRPPKGGGGRDQPHPYRQNEVRELRVILDRRWPRLPENEATRWVGRWRTGRSPYSRIRAHAIRAQLDAIIGLALRCGLRRDEIFRFDAESIHPDNAYIVVCADDGPGRDRTAEYTDSAREAIVPWIRLRRKINPDHDRTWLKLWSADTVREPMTRATFDRMLRLYVGEGWTFRRLRATCIVNLILAGHQLEHLRDQLGYSDIAELLPYARCVGGNARREMRRRDARFREVIR